MYAILLAKALVFVRSNPKPFLIGGAVLVAVLILFSIYAAGARRERDEQKAAAAVAEAHADARKAGADANATVSLERSRITTTQQEEELKRADDGQPNAAPSRARLVNACEWMRQQGANPAALSRCLASPTRD